MEHHIIRRVLLCHNVVDLNHVVISVEDITLDRAMPSIHDVVQKKHFHKK